MDKKIKKQGLILVLLALGIVALMFLEQHKQPETFIIHYFNKTKKIIYLYPSFNHPLGTFQFLEIAPDNTVTKQDSLQI